MFLERYIDNIYLNIIYNNYDEKFINNLDQINFMKVYYLFKKYNFYYIDDIILNYLEIFEMDYKDVHEEIIKLNEKLGNNFVYIIGNNMTYLNDILNA